jgi:putative transcriptional regulator
MNRLKELRKSKRLTQIELADEIKIPYRTLQRWENEESQIKQDKAKQLADFFGVSVGYLLGFTESKVDKETENVDHERFTKGFDKILSLTGYTSQEELISSLTQSLNPEKFAENFISENSSLTQEELHERYSEAVEQQVQQILGELSILSIALSYLNDEASELLTIFFFLSDDEREKLLEIARVFSQNK